MAIFQRGLPSQESVYRWRTAKWPWSGTPAWCAIKVTEEAGEVAGAVIKREEGRKSSADIEQEAAQTVIALLALAEAVGFDLADAVVDEWRRLQG